MYLILKDMNECNDSEDDVEDRAKWRSNKADFTIILDIQTWKRQRKVLFLT